MVAHPHLNFTRGSFAMRSAFMSEEPVWAGAFCMSDL